jgi:DNA-binding winged helix-turn-helix (wHTH) protein
MNVRTCFSAPIRIGDYLVDPARGVVSGAARETHLEPKDMEVLCALAAREGQVVGRADLINSIW